MPGSQSRWKVGFFRVGDQNLLDDIIKFSSEEAILEIGVLKSQEPRSLNERVKIESQGYETVVCPVISGSITCMYPKRLGNAEI